MLRVSLWKKKSLQEGEQSEVTNDSIMEHFRQVTTGACLGSLREEQFKVLQVTAANPNKNLKDHYLVWHSIQDINQENKNKQQPALDTDTTFRCGIY